MMNKKKILSLGSFIAVALPAATVVSCSTTWTTWNKKDSPQTKTKFKGSEIIERSKYVVRADSELMHAWDSVGKTLDVSKIQNQFEFVKVISNILSIASNDSVDSYWNDFNKMKTYLSSVKKVQDIRLVYGTHELNVNWDVTTVIDKAVKGIENYNSLTSITDKNNAKAFNVEDKGTQNGQPVAFGEVARIGSPLTANATVRELMAFDIGFALSLSKLVNLPKNTFIEFSNLMNKIDETLNELWSFISSANVADDMGWNFSIGTSGKIGTYDIEKKYMDLVDLYRSHNLPIPGESKRLEKIEEFKKGYLKAQFIIQALKH